MNYISLSGAQRRQLRALAHGLRPVVLLGKEGLSDAVVHAADVALNDHELIKARLPQLEKSQRKELADQLARATTANLVGLTGRVVILYRAHPEKPKIRLTR